MESAIIYNIFPIEISGKKYFFAFSKMSSLVIVGNLSRVIFNINLYPFILNKFADEIINCDTKMSKREKERIAKRAEKDVKYK